MHAVQFRCLSWKLYALETECRVAFPATFCSPSNVFKKKCTPKHGCSHTTFFSKYRQRFHYKIIIVKSNHRQTIGRVCEGDSSTQHPQGGQGRWSRVNKQSVHQGKSKKATRREDSWSPKRNNNNEDMATPIIYVVALLVAAVR